MSSTYVKYPKTMHLPWSPGLQNDDRLIESLDGFVGKQVVVTEKMDGENATMYCDHYHARSLDSRHHPSRDWMKMFHGRIKHDIPEGIRICGENLYARHSIAYDDLPSYFMGFSVWDNEENWCYSWETTQFWFELLGITPVRTIYEGTWDEKTIRALCDPYASQPGVEGYVIRTSDGYDFADFQKCVAKYVRKDHVQTDQHWMQAAIVPNGLKDVL